MKPKHTFFTIIFPALFGTSPLFSQSGISSAGTTITGESGSISMTIGQLFYRCDTGESGSVAAGVQQPFEIMVITGIGVENIALQAKAFPNPVSGQLTLLLSGEDYGEYSFKLYNPLGKTILRGEIYTTETILDLLNHQQGIYVLTVERKNQIVKSFKIIKN